MLWVRLLSFEGPPLVFFGGSRCVLASCLVRVCLGRLPLLRRVPRFVFLLEVAMAARSLSSSLFSPVSPLAWVARSLRGISVIPCASGGLVAVYSAPPVVPSLRCEPFGG